jgi:diphosphomevalonate decarboxylase
MHKSMEKYIFNSTAKNTTNFEVKWSSPSNIALVKYWGKLENQIPANASISFTLSNCKTITKLLISPSDSLSFEVWSEGNRKLSFEPKIKIFLDRILEYCPFLKASKLIIETENTFPHSSGIASSASGLSALSLCIMSVEKILNPNITESYFFEKASFLARLGSGSAARSVYPTLASWGVTSAIQESSNVIASPFTAVNDVFKDYQDSILLIDEGEKTVSSTVGHNLMHGHPFAAARFEQANSNLEKITKILETGDLDAFINIVESEALTLHAMMMSSNPYFILMKPNTLSAIEKIWNYRKQNNSKICFTLDAGANVHVLYPNKEKEAIQNFINTELSPLCQSGKVIHDFVGNGPEKLN